MDRCHRLGAVVAALAVLGGGACGGGRTEGAKSGGAPGEGEVEVAPVNPALAAAESEAAALEGIRPIAEMALAIGQVMRDATVLAAPKVAKARAAMPSREDLIGDLDGYLATGQRHADVIDPEGAPIGPRMEAVTLRLRALLVGWTPVADVPEDIRAAAREMLGAMGVAEPPGGWDAFEGYRFVEE